MSDLSLRWRVFELVASSHSDQGVSNSTLLKDFSSELRPLVLKDLFIDVVDLELEEVVPWVSFNEAAHLSKYIGFNNFI